MEKEQAIAISILDMYGLPTSYAGMDYNSTQMSVSRKREVKTKISKAPDKGLLTISGIAGPIVNQLITDGRRVRGINFLDRNGSAFETFENPEASVIVLYNVGAEVSLNSKVPGMVLRNIVKHYGDRSTLLIIETDLTRGDLLSRYDFSTPNFLVIPRADVQAWI